MWNYIELVSMYAILGYIYTTIWLKDQFSVLHHLSVELTQSWCVNVFMVCLQFYTKLTYRYTFLSVRTTPRDLQCI